MIKHLVGEEWEKLLNCSIPEMINSSACINLDNLSLHSNSAKIKGTVNNYIYTSNKLSVFHFRCRKVLPWTFEAVVCLCD